MWHVAGAAVGGGGRKAMVFAFPNSNRCISYALSWQMILQNKNETETPFPFQNGRRPCAASP